jgi:molybdenum cofactor cytidylyltransferase
MRLLEISGDTGARRLLQEYPVQNVPVLDPGIHRDVDTPADLLV